MNSTMISNVLTHIENIAGGPVVSLVLFVAVMLGVIVLTLAMSREHALQLARLPLEDSTTIHPKE